MGPLPWELGMPWEHRRNCAVGTENFILLYKCPPKKFLPSINGSKIAFSSKSFCAIQDHVFFKNPTQGFCDITTIAPILTLQNNS